MKQNAYAFYAVTLAAGETKKIYGYGRYFRILDNTSSTDAQISLGGQPFQQFPKGISAKIADVEDAFNEVSLYNSSGASMTINCTISNDIVDDSRIVISGALSVNLTPDTISSPASVSVTTSAAVAVASGATNREIVLQNNGAVDIWIGDSAVDGSANRGYKLTPGASFVWTTSAAIYARTTAGTGTLSTVINTKS